MNRHLRVNKTNFHMKGVALGLALKQSERQLGNRLLSAEFGILDGKSEVPVNGDLAVFSDMSSKMALSRSKKRKRALLCLFVCLFLSTFFKTHYLLVLLYRLPKPRTWNIKSPVSRNAYLKIDF